MCRIHLIAPQEGALPAAMRIEGDLVTLADLPASNNTRWVKSKKLILAAAVVSGLSTVEELLTRYKSLSREELMSWVNILQHRGPDGLHQRCVQGLSREKILDTPILPEDFRVSAGTLTLTSYGRLSGGEGGMTKLTRSETRLLAYLMYHSGMVVSKLALLKLMYPNDRQADQKIIDVYICKIRRKIKKAFGIHDFIITSWGRGYIVDR